MNAFILEIVLLLVLLLGNGVFAMAELAVVSSRKTRLKQLADGGDAGALAALELANNPNRFLPTVQIGITLVGLLAGTFGGITVAEQIAAALQPFALVEPYAEAIGVVVVVVVLTYFSLVLGELVPKRLALENPEGIARRLARPMDFLSRLTRPAIYLLGLSTEGLMRLLGRSAEKPAPISEEEVKLLVEEGTEAGVFHEAEPRMVESVLAFDRRPVRDIMTPRAKLVFVNRTDSHEAVWHKIVVSGHSTFPVCDGSRDRVVGVLSVKSIYANLAAGAGARIADLMTPPLLVPATRTVTQLLDAFKKTRHHVAIVTDEAGGVVGLVTLVDVLEAIVGEIPSQEDRLQPEARRREDGTWLVDGSFELAKLALLLNSVELAEAARGRSLAAFVTDGLAAPPAEGACVVWRHLQFEVIDMDHQRIDKVLVTMEPDKR
ncbi:MAG: hemolysin family protein [Verrucomicrobia bacterium]|jgi:putative hemolysin|nr:hemolysin family protein [Verrucomicrobiota bacterium]